MWRPNVSYEVVGFVYFYLHVELGFGPTLLCEIELLFIKTGDVVIRKGLLSCTGLMVTIGFNIKSRAVLESRIKSALQSDASSVD